MTNLGGMYFYGDGVKKVSREAAKLWNAAAETGYEDAQLNLTNLLNVGAEGTPMDKFLSLKWYNKAAESGIARIAFSIRHSPWLHWKLCQQTRRVDMDTTCCRHGTA